MPPNPENPDVMPPFADQLHRLTEELSEAETFHSEIELSEEEETEALRTLSEVARRLESYHPSRWSELERVSFRAGRSGVRSPRDS